MRALEDQTVLDRYIEIKAEMARLENEIEDLRGQIIYALFEEDDEKYSHHGFTFYLTSRKYYDYSPAVQEAKDNLYRMKKHEEASGVAPLKKHISILNLKELKGDGI